MKKLTKVLICVISILVLAVISALVFYFTRPLVLYVESSYLSESDLFPSFLLSSKFRLKVVSEEEYIPSDEVLIIMDPISKVESDKKCAVWGRDDDRADINIRIDEKKMYLSFSSIPFIYQEGDSYAKEIIDSNTSLIPVSYSGRVSNVNLDSTLKQLEGYESAILFDPDSATLLLDRSETTFYVDFRYYSALSGYRNVKAIKPLWKEALESALSLKEGDISLDFAL